MANRYQSFTFTTASVASGVVLQASQVLGPHCYNLVKLKIVRNTGAGNINFRIFKKGVWGSANRLIRFENQTVPLVQPVDKTSGSPGVEALEGVPLPVDDEDGTNFDGTGKLHHELENLGTTSTFTISGEYEEVVVLSGAGDPSWRGAVSALTSLSLRGATSGTAIIAAPAVAGTPTLTLPTASGTFARLQDKLSAFAATTSAELAGVISDETGSGALVFATSPTFVTPTLGVATGTRLGLGAAADATYLLNLNGALIHGSSTGVGLGTTAPATNLEVFSATSAPASGNAGWDAGAFLDLTYNGVAVDGGSSVVFRAQQNGTPSSLLGYAAIKGAVEGTNAGYLSFLTRTNSVYATERLRISSAGIVTPGADNAQDFGSTSLRWKDGYFGGTLRFGTRTALGAETLSGYITITDAGGTTRKLAVIS